MENATLWTAIGVLLVAGIAIIRGIVVDSRVKATLETQITAMTASAEADRKRFISEIAEIRKSTEINTRSVNKLEESQDWVRKFAERQEGEINNINKAVGDLNKAIVKLETTLTALNENIINSGGNGEAKRTRARTRKTKN
jgi:chromosome segregation ATPase